MPNRAANISSQGELGPSASRKPPSSIITMPKTRWWTCRPPSVSTLPGHQVTFGLRIRRALVRMKRNDPSSASMSTSPDRAPSWESNVCSPPISRMTSAIGLMRIPYARARMNGNRRFSDRTRGMASVALVVLGAALLLAGVVAYYLRTEVLNEEAFADRAVVALEDDRVRKVVSREIVVNLIDRGSTDLVAARPLLEGVVSAVIG